MQCLKSIIIILVTSLFSNILFAQNCFNANFETGEIDGYSHFIGRIASDGTITVDDEIFSPEQHKIHFILDGNDPIAEEYCTDNIELPMVPPDGGAFALRLGNSQGGAYAEKVTISFTVTPDNNFFLLNYAVLLNDPGHQPFEQPRFKLSIVDSQGDEYPCGYYEVAAAENIENFENCNGNWKVRPWTTIGIELQSYLGETISIEMRTNDCSRGGHAGYAYLDANCQPLEIELYNNCDENSLASMKVTSGFDSYLWSTGDTGSEILIDGPVVGDIYYVTVTSATGCDLILSDTIPEFTTEAEPEFGPSTTTSLCDGTMWFRPEGINLYQIYSVELGRFIDSMIVNSVLQESYTYIAYSESGCPQDTVTHFFIGLPYVSDTIVNVSCYEEKDGSVKLEPLKDGVYSYSWSNGMTGPIISNLEKGNYLVTITNGTCTLEEEYTVTEPDSIRTNVWGDDFICFGDQGSASIFVSGGTSPYEYSYDGGDTFVSSSWYNDFTEEENTILIKDKNGCMKSVIVYFELIPEIKIELAGDFENCPGNNTAAISITAENGYEPYTYSFNNSWNFETQDNFNDLSSGTYTVFVQDANRCREDTTFSISDRLKYENLNLIVRSDTCNSSLGGIVSGNIVNGISPPYTYSLDSFNFRDIEFIDNLNYGIYTLFVQDGHACIWQETFEIENIHTTSLFADVINTTCALNNGEIELTAVSGFNNEYFLNGISMGNDTTFTNLEPGVYNVLTIDRYGCRDSVTVEILGSSLPQVSETIINNPCSYSTDGSISLTETILPANYNYEWSNGENSNNLSDLKNGDYSVTVTDSDGCSQVFDYSIDSPDSLMLELDGQFYNCPGYSEGLITIYSSGGFGEIQYSIDGGNNYYSTPDFSNLQSGEYEILIRDENLCMLQSSVLIEDFESYEAIELSIAQDTCNLGQGALSIGEIIDGSGPFSFSLNGSNFQDEEVINELFYGAYQLYIKDGNGCVWEEIFVIDTLYTLHLTSEVKHTECNENNGKIDIFPSSFFDNTYSLNNGTEQKNGTFDNIAPGNYSVIAINKFGCSDTLRIEINESTKPELDYDISYTSCLKNNNVVHLETNLGIPPYLFRINEEDYQQEGIFYNLDAGNYTLTVKDDKDCLDEINVYVEEFDSVIVQNITAKDPRCDQSDGSISLSTDGGAGPLTVIYNEQPFSVSHIFEDLSVGQYFFSIVDTTDCSVSVEIELGTDCSYYSPNIFSPNDDGINDLFEIIFSDGARPTVNYFRVYDRWGGLVYELENSNGVTWDGKLNFNDVVPGVYTYILNAKFQSGEPILDSGTITVIR